MRRHAATQVRKLATYAWGGNDARHLGIPEHYLTQLDSPPSIAATKPYLMRYFGDRSVTDASVSEWRAAFVTDDGLVHATRGVDGDEGLRRVEGIRDVVGVACGRGHTLAVGADGGVYAGGRGEYGQLGGAEMMGMDGFGRVEILWRDGVRAKRVAAGGEFSACVCREGGVYTWGRSDGGRLGRERRWFEGREEVEKPRRVGGLLRDVGVEYVACGEGGGVAVDGEGRAYAWGKGCWWGDAGGDMGSVCSVFRGVGGIVKVDVGSMHALALTRGGEVWGIGVDDKGCLGGHGGGLVRLARDVKDVAAGCRFSMAVTLAGHVMAWGCGEGGALGVGQPFDYWHAVNVGIKANRIVASTSGTSVISF